MQHANEIVQNIIWKTLHIVKGAHSKFNMFISNLAEYAISDE